MKFEANKKYQLMTVLCNTLINDIHMIKCYCRNLSQAQMNAVDSMRFDLGMDALCQSEYWLIKTISRGFYDEQKLESIETQMTDIQDRLEYLANDLLTENEFVEFRDTIIATIKSFKDTRAIIISFNI